ncbi:MAG: DUF3667 domain-containing protein [Ignavibacteria bacterium]|nr:DUF3667 domain-containing protein [Ignavibacteria bacterium]
MNTLSSHEHCLNCGEKLVGKFCSKCGQELTHLNVPFSHIVKEFLGNYLHFDSYVISSIKLLLFKPGFLTKEFIEGKRVRHIPPLRMYFFISVLYFLFAPTENQIRFADKNDVKETGGVSFNKNYGNNVKLFVADDSSRQDSLAFQISPKEKTGFEKFHLEKLSRK